LFLLIFAIIVKTYLQLFLFVQYLYNTIKIQIKWKTEDNYNKKTKKIYKQTNEKYGNKKKRE